MSESSGFKRIPGLPSKYQEFILSLFCTLALPLAPIAIEWFFFEKVTQSTLLVSAIMYIFSNAFSTSNKVTLIFLTIAAATLCIFFGIEIQVQLQARSSSAAHAEGADYGIRNAAYILMAFSALAHGIERYHLHLCDLKPFLDFSR